jgi:hypothetical protein
MANKTYPEFADITALTAAYTTLIWNGSANKEVSFHYIADWVKKRFGYKISVTVSSSDLIVSLLTPEGNTPSATEPIFVTIGFTTYAITAATSITIADGTNWFASGSAELGTQLVPYFVYLVYDSNSSVVALSIARIPYGRTLGDFSATTTNQKHLFNYANFTATDDVVNIGYFEATLSLSGTSHVWTVPTFTNSNLKHEPTFESGHATWVPTITGFTATVPTSAVYLYRIVGRRVIAESSQGGNGTSNATTFTMTAPFTAVTLASAFWAAPGYAPVDNGSLQTATAWVSLASNSATINVWKNADGGTTAWTNANGKRVGFFRLDYPIG